MATLVTGTRIARIARGLLVMAALAAPAPSARAAADDPTILATQIVGSVPLVAGCRSPTTLVAVVSDPQSDASSVSGALTLDGVLIGVASLRSVVTPPPGAGPLPPGQIFSGRLQLRTPLPGQLDIVLTAHDRAGHVSPPSPISVPIVVNAPPVVSDAQLSDLTFIIGVQGSITATARVSDDCGVRGLSIEIDQANGQGFRRVGSLRDDGRGGDLVAGDGIWGGTGRAGFRAPGNFAVRLRAEDTLRATGDAGPFTAHVAGNDNTVSGSVIAAASTFVDSDVNDPLAPFASNDSLGTAQDVPSPLTLGGHVNLAGAGDPGATFLAGDESDFFRVPLTAGQTVALQVGDPDVADLDLCLLDGQGATVDCAVGTGAVESLTAPSTGAFYVEVFPSPNCACGSNYVLTIGQESPASARREMRLSDAFVPDQAIVTYAEPPADAAAAPGSASAAASTAPPGTTAIAGAPDRAMLLSLDAAGTGGAGQSAARRSSAFSSELSPDQQRALETILAVKALRRRPGVASADLNFIHAPLLVPNDPLYPFQGHYLLVNLPSAWDLTTGSSNVIVAVIDTGVLLNHPDLQGQLVSGYDFISSVSRAADGGGIDSNPDDPGDGGQGGASSFHGTHVAGTVAARTNNGVGVAGVAWNARIMPLRVLGVGGGTDYDVIQAVRFAVRLSNDSGTLPPQAAAIINLSLGGAGFSQTAQDAFTAARNAGVIVIAAAGNTSNNEPRYPASYDGVVSVSAVGPSKDLAPYSSFGPTVDVAAPGGDLSVDLNGDGRADGVLSTLGDDSVSPIRFVYGSYNGTSMAAPHVSGIAALMKSVAPELTPAQFDSLLAGGSITEDRGAPGRDDLFGYGLIDARAAVAGALALAGSPPVDTPLLVATPGSLGLPASASEAIVEVRNGGAGALAVTNVSEDSGGWLSVTPLDVDGNGLGTYRATVNRAGLSAGAYSAHIVFTSTANIVSVPVVMNVGGSVVSNAGHHYVVLYDAKTLEPLYGNSLLPSDGVYSFEMDHAPAGDYFLIAGTDLDNDGFICDGGEACGAYPALDLLDALRVRGNLTGLTFVTGFNPVFGAGGTRVGGVPVPPEGFRLPAGLR